MLRELLNKLFHSSFSYMPKPTIIVIVLVLCIALLSAIYCVVCIYVCTYVCIAFDSLLVYPLA